MVDTHSLSRNGRYSKKVNILDYQPAPNNHDKNTLLGRICGVLWDSWDPLDTNGTQGAPDDEYDSYGAAIVTLVEQVLSIEAIASHLSRIQIERMGRPDTPDRNKRVAEKLLACAASDQAGHLIIGMQLLETCRLSLVNKQKEAAMQAAQQFAKGIEEGEWLLRNFAPYDVLNVLKALQEVSESELPNGFVYSVLALAKSDFEDSPDSDVILNGSFLLAVLFALSKLNANSQISLVNAPPVHPRDTFQALMSSVSGRILAITYRTGCSSNLNIAEDLMQQASQFRFLSLARSLQDGSTLAVNTVYQTLATNHTLASIKLARDVVLVDADYSKIFDRAVYANLLERAIAELQMVDREILALQFWKELITVRRAFASEANSAHELYAFADLLGKAATVLVEHDADFAFTIAEERIALCSKLLRQSQNEINAKRLAVALFDLLEVFNDLTYRKQYIFILEQLFAFGSISQNTLDNARIDLAYEAFEMSDYVTASRAYYDEWMRIDPLVRLDPDFSQDLDNLSDRACASYQAGDATGCATFFHDLFKELWSNGIVLSPDFGLPQGLRV